MRAALALLVVAACGRTSLEASPPVLARSCDEPVDRYHRSTLEHDRCPLSFADVEAEYSHALERLGGCPTYTYRDEWCPTIETDDFAPESVSWHAWHWAGATTCRELYWTRGAYCLSLEEGRVP